MTQKFSLQGLILGNMERLSRASIIKHHRLDEITDIYSSQFWRLKSDMRVPTWSDDIPLLGYRLLFVSSEEGGQGSSVGSLSLGNNSSNEGSAIMT